MSASKKPERRRSSTTNEHVNFLDAWKQLALGSKLVAGIVAAILLVEGGVKIVQDISGLVDTFGTSERSERIAGRSARLVVGAFELGGDVPMAVYGLAGGDTGIVSLPAYESRVRANLTLLKLDVRYPPDIPPGETPFEVVVSQLMHEQIRPRFARMEDPKPEVAFQYGFHWTQASLMAHRITSEAMPYWYRVELFATLQRNAKAPEPERLEAELALPPELIDQAEAIRRDIGALESETDVLGLYDLESAITLYGNNVWRELCSRPGADCGYEIGPPAPSPSR